MPENDNAGDERDGLWPIDTVSPLPEAILLVESAGLGTGEPLSETVRQSMAEGVPVAYQDSCSREI